MSVKIKQKPQKVYTQTLVTYEIIVMVTNVSILNDSLVVFVCCFAGFICLTGFSDFCMYKSYDIMHTHFEIVQPAH